MGSTTKEVETTVTAMGYIILAGLTFSRSHILMTRGYTMANMAGRLGTNCPSRKMTMI